MFRPPAVSRLMFACVLALPLACGQKGPPLPPLHLVPAAPGDASVMRIGTEARLRFTIPSTNLNGPGAIDIDHLEIFAATVAPGAAPPANRDFLTAKYRVGTVAVKPPPVEGETPPAEAPPDSRPSAGEKATFVEKLTPETLTPVFTTPPPKAAPPTTPATAGAARAGGAALMAAAAALAGAGPAAAAASAAASVTGAAAKPEEAPPPYPTRLYTVRGVTRSGRPGQPAARLQLPLVDPPPAPSAVTAGYTETAITLSWTAPESETPTTFNIYKVDGVDPINSAPVSGHTYERSGVEFGKEECFVLRSVRKIGAVQGESEPSEPACTVAKDTFAPKAPQHVTVVAAPGVISLSWDANTEADLGGYLVLRGEAGGDTLQPLTAAPITATNFEDKTATPGVRYTYAIVAVDKATPPNRSAESARIEETAR